MQLYAMKPYRDFSDFLNDHFRCKMQKLTVNAGFSCPNRDGTKGYGGCTYCNNQSFNPEYCSMGLSVTEQLERGKNFFRRKYPDMRYLAYFQAYTNTHDDDIDRLMSLYNEAVRVDGVDGLIIGTRPDCMPDSLLSRLKELPWVMVEYGAETSHNATLELVNRCHTWEETVNAVMRTHNMGIPCGLHLIMGLPGETEAMMMETIDKVNTLPVDTVKVHQLQLVKGTKMAKDVESGLYDIPRFTAEEYAPIAPSPAELLIYPRWNLKNYQFTQLLNNKLAKD